MQTNGAANHRIHDLYSTYGVEIESTAHLVWSWIPNNSSEQTPPPGEFKYKVDWRRCSSLSRDGEYLFDAENKEPEAQRLRLLAFRPIIRSHLCSQSTSGDLHLSMSSLIHPFIGIMTSMTFDMREVPLDILDLFEIQSGLHDLFQVVELGLPASGQQSNSQLAVRLDQQVISTAIRMAVSSMALLVVQGDFPERNSSLSKTAQPPSVVAKT